jgi:hypothetical protein
MSITRETDLREGLAQINNDRGMCHVLFYKKNTQYRYDVPFPPTQAKLPGLGPRAAAFRKLIQLAVL